MPKLRISYPSLVWHAFDVFATDQQASEVMEMDNAGKAAFIERKIKQQAIQREPHELESALEVDYATIKRI